MVSTVVRRPLPALISLVALLLLTGIVWWRVMNRDDDDTDTQAASCPTPSSSVSRTVLPAPASISVQVLNATTKNGLAAKVSTSLDGAGFQTAEPGNDKKKHTSPAVITYGPTGKQAAALVRYYFPGATLSATTRKTSTVVVSLGSRFTAVASPTAVAAALKRADVAVASSAPPTPSTGSSTGSTTGSTASC